MKKNLYYRNVFRRHNAIKEALLGFFYDFCSYPRLLLEVFIKQDFGERYFSFSSAVIITVFLFFVPFPLYSFASLLYGFSAYGTVWSTFFLHFLTWYVFLAAFMYFCRKHRKDLQRSPSVFDFARFSLSTGSLTPLFQKFFSDRGDIRTREILLEPMLFFAVGGGLMILGQWVGLLLILSSMFYGFGYWGAYHKADNFVMDKIDEMILNEELEASFVQDETPENTRGVRFFARKPNSEEMRRKVAESFLGGDEDETIAR